MGVENMNNEKIGPFICRLRKEKNLSQSQLAKELGVTSQAISKWENGRGIPDIALLTELANFFEVDVSELLQGERLPKQKKKKRLFLWATVAVFLIIGGISIFLFSNSQTFEFASLTSHHNAFQVKGIMAYDKTKKSIYISDIIYDGEKEEEYTSLECILYEEDGDSIRKISQCESMDEGDNLTTSSTLSELLKGIEFNIDHYSCSCNSTVCNQLFLKINAKNTKDQIISYEIPIDITSSCSTTP